MKVDASTKSGFGFNQRRQGTKMEGQRDKRVVLLGDEPEGTRNKAGLLNSGGVFSVKFFEDENEFHQFWYKLDDLKNKIAHLNGLHRGGALADDDYLTKVEDEWLNVSVRDFVSTYGLDSVPNDVRWAVDDVIGHLNTTVVADIIVDWPPVKYSGLDMNCYRDWVHFSVMEFSISK